MMKNAIVFIMWKTTFKMALILKMSLQEKGTTVRTLNARVKWHLEPIHLKSSPLFTFSTKSLGQDSPLIHLFSKIIGSRFTIAKMKLGEDSPSWFVFSRSRFTFKKKKKKTMKRTFVQDSKCFKYY